MQFLTNLAVTDSPENLIVFAGMLVAFWGILSQMNKQSAKDRDADRAERKKLVSALDDVAKSNQRIADETKRSADEAKERNGHLAELTIQSSQQMLEAIRNIKEQKVTHQTVEHEHILSKE